MHSQFLAFSDGILNNPESKFNPKGYNIDRKKLNNVSFINITWVLENTAQKQEIKYQKKIVNNKVSTKKIMNFIAKQFLIALDFFLAISNFSSCFKAKILFSDKDNCFNIVLITAEITEEYIIWGIWYNKLKAPLSS